MQLIENYIFSETNHTEKKVVRNMNELVVIDHNL